MAVFHGAVRLQQHYFLIIAHNAQYQAFGEKIGDLFDGEVHHRHHLPAGKLFRPIQARDLSRRAFDAQFGAKVYFELVSGIAGLFKRDSFQDGAYPYLHFFEIVPGDCFHADDFRKRKLMRLGKKLPGKGGKQDVEG